jgi:hypothetical protein
MSERENSEKKERALRSQDLIAEQKRKSGVGQKVSPYARDPSKAPREEFSGPAPCGNHKE